MKISINEIKKLIKESKLEEAYHHKFVENFKDVREQDELSDEQIDSLAEELFREIFTK
tara:strand:+ start:276 stop:449 length:174 start_codon:yes stop_codon:yes gene_type:complete